MSTASSYVFVSYAHQDADAVDALVRALENRGISFRSDRDIGIGEGWKDRLGQWLNDAEAVLVVWSPHSAVSASVIGEATRARGRLVPVSLTGMPAVPRDFQDLQTLDLSLWTGDFSDPRLEQLAQI